MINSPFAAVPDTDRPVTAPNETGGRDGELTAGRSRCSSPDPQEGPGRRGGVTRLIEALYEAHRSGVPF